MVGDGGSSVLTPLTSAETGFTGTGFGRGVTTTGGGGSSLRKSKNETVPRASETKAIPTTNPIFFFLPDVAAGILPALVTGGGRGGSGRNGGKGGNATGSGGSDGTPGGGGATGKPPTNGGGAAVVMGTGTGGGKPATVATGSGAISAFTPASGATGSNILNFNRGTPASSSFDGIAETDGAGCGSGRDTEDGVVAAATGCSSFFSSVPAFSFGLRRNRGAASEEAGGGPTGVDGGTAGGASGDGAGAAGVTAGTGSSSRLRGRRRS